MEHRGHVLGVPFKIERLAAVDDVRAHEGRYGAWWGPAWE
jgi:hypothetical protein